MIYFIYNAARSATKIFVLELVLVFYHVTSSIHIKL